LTPVELFTRLLSATVIGNELKSLNEAAKRNSFQMAVNCQMQAMHRVESAIAKHPSLFE